MGSLERIFERNRYSELRRRIVRRAMRLLIRAGDTHLTQPRDLSGSNIHRILICRPNHRLGNLLLLTPLVAEIQRLFPDADVDIVLAGEHVTELFQAFPNVRHIHNLSRRMVRHPIALVRTAVRLRRARYDLAIDPCETSQSSRLLVAVAKPKYAIGAPRSLSATGSVPERTEQTPTHMAQWPVYQFRRAVNAQSPGPEFPALDILLSEQERLRARTRLARVIHADDPSHFQRTIGVFAAATGAKGYDVDWWQRFVRTVGARHPDAAIVEIVPADGQPRLALPFFGSPSPREVAAVIANMTCFVSADCGVMHLASAAGVPTIGLFKASDPSKYAPYGHGSRALDTNGKSPEEIAELASTVIGTFTQATPPGPHDRSRGEPMPSVTFDAAVPGPGSAGMRGSKALL